MKKIYLTLIVAFVALVNVAAQTGNYTGDATVKGGNAILSLNVDETVEGLSIELNSGENNYVLTIENLNLGGLDLPLLEIDNVEIADIEGGYKLSRAGTVNITVPEITIPASVGAPLGGQKVTNVPVAITLTNGSVVNDVLNLNIKIVATVMLSLTFNVEFEGTLNIPTGFSETKADIVSIYPTVVESEINVAGIKNAEYIIYTQAGVAVKQGITSGTITVGGLGSGVYILNIAGKTANFIKK